jgi:hypothetical protein
LRLKRADGAFRLHPDRWASVPQGRLRVRAIQISEETRLLTMQFVDFIHGQFSKQGPLKCRSLGCARDDKGEGNASMESDDLATNRRVPQVSLLRPGIPATELPWKSGPPLCHPERSRGICSSTDLSWKCFRPVRAFCGVPWSPALEGQGWHSRCSKLSVAQSRMTPVHRDGEQSCA